MEPNLPWLSQGDVLEDVPQFGLVLDIHQTPKAVLHGSGPALLVTHHCDLDKVTRRGVLQVERLQFLPLRLVANLDANRQGLLRSRKLSPPEAFYVGECPGFGEAYCLLGDMFTVPAEYFRPIKRKYPSDARAEPDGHLTATINGQRFGTIDAEDLDLLRRKIVAFYTRSAVVGTPDAGAT